MTTITPTAEALEIIENKINQESDRLRSTIRRWRETAQARLSIGDEAGADRYLAMSAEARVKIHTLSASVMAIKSVLGN